MTTPDAMTLPIYRGPINFRTVASAILVFLGGYLVLGSLSGQLAYLLSGISPNPVEFSVLLVSQLVFAVAAVVAGLVLAPAPSSLRLIASAIVVVTVIVTIVSQIARLTGSAGAAGVPLSITTGNGYFMVLLGVGAAWLVVRRARLGWLALLAAFIMMPVPYFFAIGSIPAIVTQIVSLVLSALIGAGIIIAGRPLRD